MMNNLEKNIVDKRNYLRMHLLKRLMFIKIDCITKLKYAATEFWCNLKAMKRAK